VAQSAVRRQARGTLLALDCRKGETQMLGSIARAYVDRAARLRPSPLHLGSFSCAANHFHQSRFFNLAVR
jgi:hypothetical protein